MRISPLLLGVVVAVSLIGCTSAQVSDVEEEEIGAERVTIAWGIGNAQTDEAGMTRADISLVVTKDSGKVHTLPLGSFAGCGAQDALKGDVFLSLKCWWAGGGDDFQVRMDATNVLVVEHRTVDESLDIPPFTALRSLILEDGVVIVPVVAESL